MISCFFAQGINLRFRCFKFQQGMINRFGEFLSLKSGRIILGERAGGAFLGLLEDSKPLFIGLVRSHLRISVGTESCRNNQPSSPNYGIHADLRG